MQASSKSSARAARRVEGWPPRYLTKTTAAERRAGDGAAFAEFVEGFCRITKDSYAGRRGEHITLRPWQHELFRWALARRTDTGRRRHRRVLVGVARKNTKSTLGAGFALNELVCGPDGGEIYSCAADKYQARIVFGTARDMVALDPELDDLVKVYKDVLEVPLTGSIYRVLSAEAFTKEGLNPTAVVFDELHAQPDRELWDVMNLGLGARIDPLVLAITTAGVLTDSHGRDTICVELYEYGKAVASGEEHDPSFGFCWWEPKRGAGSDHRDPAVWAESNPGLITGLIDPQDFEDAVRTTPESEFRIKRTNVFVAGSHTALPHGVWQKRADPDRSIEGKPVVLFVDGSWSGDCTGFVGCTIEDRPHLFVVDCWERPLDAVEWRVPINDVKQRILDTARSTSNPAREVDLDPFRWQQTIADLEDEGLLVAEYPTSSPQRMVPAWKKFYDAVLDGGLSHDGDPRLARHVANMQLKVDRFGARPVKENPASKRHIDLGICAVAAFDRATAPAAGGPVVLTGELMA
ncbi:MAG: terminase large subunit [Actinobacteria bacterium]|nr:terminase large subunit [Actinomycetota bacterium]